MDPYKGLDPGSPNTVTAESISEISIPILIGQGLADVQVYVSDTRDVIFGSTLKSQDKEYFWLKEADQGLSGPAQDAPRREVVRRYVSWLDKRFPD